MAINLIIQQEDFSALIDLASIEPRDYRVVFKLQKAKHEYALLFVNFAFLYYG